MSSTSLFGQAGNNNSNSGFSSTSTKKMTSSSNGHTTTNAAQSSSSSFYALPTNSFAGVSQSELDDLRQAFQLFDTEKGKILLKDVRTVLESISNKSSVTTNTNNNTTLNRVIARVRSLSDKNNNNDTQQLSMSEFIQLMTQSDPNDKRSEVRKVFDLFDVDRKGYINVDDLGRVATDLGEVMDRQELQEMIQRASSSSSLSSSSASSGKVYPQDFEAVMSKRLFS
jgi:Ca2+-binding EF-hand superfamily protein